MSWIVALVPSIHSDFQSHILLSSSWKLPLLGAWKHFLWLFKYLRLSFWAPATGQLFDDSVWSCSAVKTLVNKGFFFFHVKNDSCLQGELGSLEVFWGWLTITDPHTHKCVKHQHFNASFQYLHVKSNALMIYCLILNLWFKVTWVKSTISSSHFHLLLVCQSCFILLLVQFRRGILFSLILGRMKLFLILKYWTRDFIAFSHVKNLSLSHSALERKIKEKELWHSEIFIHAQPCVFTLLRDLLLYSRLCMCAAMWKVCRLILCVVCFYAKYEETESLRCSSINKIVILKHHTSLVFQL